ncbi:MAG: hypothetical protein KC431_16375, partial [Myxococcales bacterium]|nr:hypothetical protein [Myxococcales bacterium]
MPRVASARVVLALMTAATLACDPLGESTSPDRSDAATARPLPPSDGDPDGSIRLILNNPEGRPAPVDRCEVELCTSLLSMIEGAQTSIDFAIYGMRNQSQILAALEAAKARGVEIRGIVDRDVEGDNYYTSTNTMAARLGKIRDDQRVDQALEREFLRDERSMKFDAEPACNRPEGFNGYVQCLAYDLGDSCLLATHASREQFGAGDDDNSGKAFNKIMHDKFFVVDGRYVWTGSTNVSDSGTGGYNANLV